MNESQGDISLIPARALLRVVILLVLIAFLPLIIDLAERHARFALLAMVFGVIAGVGGGPPLFFVGFSTQRVAVGPAVVTGRALFLTGIAWAISMSSIIVFAATGRGGLALGYLITILAAVGALVLIVLFEWLMWSNAASVSWIRRTGEQPVRGRWRSVGEASAVMSTCLTYLSLTILVAIVMFAAADQVEGGNVIDSAGNSVEPGTPTEPLTSATDHDILLGFSPLISYGAGDGDMPISADVYLGDATVTSIAPVAGDVALDKILAPPTCERQVDPCVLVKHPDCRAVASCTPFVLDLTQVGPLAVDDRIVAYGRVLRRGTDGIPWETSPFGDELTIVAQWWYFTPIDDWKDDFLAGAGHATKRHDADWEQITIGFSDTEPLFVAYSSHCGGRWRLWNDVLIFNNGYAPIDGLGIRLHPQAERTDGSHGFYFSALEGQAPDTGECVAKPFRALFRSHLTLAGVDDLTASTGYLLPRLIEEVEAEATFDYPAVWSTGTTAKFKIAGFTLLDVDDRSDDEPNGPEGPSFKPIFSDPLGTIFCSGSGWTHENPHSRRVNGTHCD